jgi:DNA polymerase III alpha subunit
MWTETNTIDQLVSGVIKHGPDVLKYSQTSDDLQKYLDRISREFLDYPIPPNSVDSKNWFIPAEYKSMDIEEFLVNSCPEQNYDRLVTELELYRKHDMIEVLKAMKFIVDHLRKNNIVWGVGRGSSVASYALYLIGVHKIDSVKYDLPIEEFFKGEQNG